VGVIVDEAAAILADEERAGPGAERRPRSGGRV